MANNADNQLRPTMQARLGGGDGIEALLGAFDELLARTAGATTHQERIAGLIELLQWLFGGPETEALALLSPADTGGWRADPAAIDRVHLVVAALEQDAGKRSRLREAVLTALSPCDGRSMFGDAGMPGDRGFLGEGTDRLLNHLLPRPRNDLDLSDVVHRWLGNQRVAARVQRLGPELFARFCELLCPPAATADWGFLARDFTDGMRLLAVRIVAQGLSAKLRRRQPQETVAESPFVRHQQALERLLDAWLTGTPREDLLAGWREQVQACQLRLAHIRSHIENQGVSVDIVYGLEVIRRGLSQLDGMVGWIAAAPGSSRWNLMRRMVIRTSGFIHQDRSLRHLAQTNLNLLHLKIVERAGHTGEHYIAKDGAEYRHIWVASLGGGLLTTLTAAIKCALAGLPGAGFVHGLAYGLNYASSFVVMQHLGLMLATKQPAMTAATLANSLRESAEEQRLERLAASTIGIISSQVAAALGNIIAVTLGCLAFNRGWQALTGHSFLALDKATRLMEDLSPVDSLTIFYAALTGVILWWSSLVGGWFDNWTAYHQLPQGIADHRWGQRLGRERLRRLAILVRTHAAGWGTNISLGLMLGFTPVIGAFLGIPLDVRHVTLNSGMLALACTTDGLDWWHFGAVGYALLGIACMFVLNLGVSFGLSLVTAMRAHDLPLRTLFALLARVARTLLRRPWLVVVPAARTAGDRTGAAKEHPAAR